MTTEAQLEIPIENQLLVFKEHLDDTHNERIIFSGIFGIGKSYFLEKYFEKNRDRYLAINLAPVNYSISNNEDIFRLIKYDILYELIVKHELELETEVISRHIAYGTILSSNADSILGDLLNVAPLLNKNLGGNEELLNPAPFVKFLKKIIPQIEKIEEQRKDANLNQRVLEYIKDLEQSALFESDFITGFIINSLEKLSPKNVKQKVLIIDDLDRIDPEHIFRLFNIFSSHLSYRKSTGNKFGFDKVIFVCDIENIRNIFSARYGASTDFSGYIDKFYSTDIFYFDNSEEVAAITNNIIGSINFGEDNYLRECLRNNESGLLRFLLKRLLYSGSLNMRRVTHIYNNSYILKAKSIELRGSKQSIENWRLPAIIALEILVWIYGETASLEKALNKVILFEKSRSQELSRDLSRRERLAEHFIPIIDASNHNFDVRYNGDNSTEENLSFEFEGRKVLYRLNHFGNFRDNEYYYAEIRSRPEDNKSIISDNFFEIVISALDVLKASGHFKR
jgi:hypothetical protein